MDVGCQLVSFIYQGVPGHVDVDRQSRMLQKENVLLVSPGTCYVIYKNMIISNAAIRITRNKYL